MGIIKAYCRKCGGSGKLYELQNNKGERIILPLSDVDDYKYKGYKEVCAIDCSVCDGTGMDTIF